MSLHLHLQEWLMCPSSGGGKGGGGAGDEKHLVLPRFHQQDTECEMWMKRAMLRRKTRGRRRRRRRKRLARNWNGALCLCSSWWKSILAFCCLLSFCYSAFLCVPRLAGDGGAACLKTASVKTDVKDKVSMTPLSRFFLSYLGNRIPWWP